VQLGELARGVTDAWARAWARQGLAWTYVHLLHGAVTYPLLHWNKGSPVQLDQGRYDGLTFWEQLDDGVQHTATRKFFTAVPARPAAARRARRPLLRDRAERTKATRTDGSHLSTRRGRSGVCRGGSPCGVRQGPSEVCAAV
jgi:hypothetical protein